MVFLGQVRDIPAEAVEALHDPVSGVALHQVIIPHDKDDVDRFVRGEKVTVKSESMKEGVKVQMFKMSKIFYQPNFER